MTFFILAIVFVVALLFVLGLHTFDRVDTEIEIEGSADEVWKAITNFNEYTEWNPAFTTFSGDFKEGATVGADFVLPFSKTLPLNLQIQDIVKGKEFSLASKLLEPKILDTVHTLKIEKTEEGNIRFSQEERFSGLLLYIIFPIIRGTIERNFENMNSALKQRIEGVVEISDTSQATLRSV